MNKCLLQNQAQWQDKVAKLEERLEKKDKVSASLTLHFCKGYSIQKFGAMWKQIWNLEEVGFLKTIRIQGDMVRKNRRFSGRLVCVNSFVFIIQGVVLKHISSLEIGVFQSKESQEFGVGWDIDFEISGWEYTNAWNSGVENVSKYLELRGMGVPENSEFTVSGVRLESCIWFVIAYCLRMMT